MASGIQVPLEAAVLLCLCGAVVGGWLSNLRAGRRFDPRRNPLRDLLRHDNLGTAVDLALHRNARRQASSAVLQGRIDVLATGENRWSPDTAEAVRAHVLAVMRVGLRRQDRVAMNEGGHVSILVPGADEGAAVRVAERLGRGLGQLRLPQLGSDVRLTASFGVAAERFGESGEGLERRARRALDAAVARGSDHVVPASEIEEIRLLPPPAPTTASASAA
ncbi:diguanylate cyclase domain-containing protein [Erythrobacter sp. WG]|uniref:diguanylate cyclase domain-containing protein n=1 Tax=Erythrobacter sp. WG TaxID=2985510 RepID=UPI002272236D|nr:diguanylate cyclase [Erythrobacter sp. WG]MCX9148563.1 diguanylate cyclase [Erythrobacter sp. WG]